MIKENIIDILESNKYICFVIPKLFSENECNELLTDDIKNSFVSAIANYPTYYRNNERMVIDSEVLAKKLFEKVKEYLPSKIKIKSKNDIENGVWSLKNINERIRYCKYSQDQYFNRHLDGIYHKSEKEHSKLTFIIYLNNSDEFSGGRTLFYKNKNTKKIWKSYSPQKGDLIIFDHNIWHEGEIVSNGEKYILRSDILYELEKKSNNNSKQKDNENHLGYIWKLLPFNENFFISAGRDKTICIWNKNYKCLQKIEAHENSVTCLEQLTKKSFISGSRDKTIKLWELKGKNQFELKDTFNFHNATVLSLCKISDDIFASSGADNAINIYNIKEKSIKTLYGHNNWVWNILKISENILVSCSEDRTIKIWDLEKYECLQTIEEKNPIHSLAFDHKNNILFSGNEKGVINLRLKENNFIKEKKLSFKVHNGIIKNILIIDGKILASCGEDNKVNLIDINTKKRVFSYKHNNFVQSLILFKDTLISASYDGIIKKLDLKTVINI